jgi:hypothetical protein
VSKRLKVLLPGFIARFLLPGFLLPGFAIARLRKILSRAYRMMKA